MIFAPAILQPHYVEKPWGGQTLRVLYGKKLPYEKTGESWEVSTLVQGESLYQGKPLSFWIKEETFRGTKVEADFPLLIKLLDAQQPLSVQVHPNDAYARCMHGDPYGKNEAWVVLAAKEDARLIVDFSGDCKALRKSAYDGTLNARLNRVPVKAGDVLFIPAGTVHAIGEGILIYEIQQPSDRTYRFYAYEREGVALDTERALDVSRHTQVEVKDAFPAYVLLDAEDRPAGTGFVLLRTPYFSLDKLLVEKETVQESTKETFCCYTVMDGKGQLCYQGGKLNYAPGDTIFVPAGLGRFTLCGGTLLKALPPIKEG